MTISELGLGYRVINHELDNLLFILNQSDNFPSWIFNQNPLITYGVNRLYLQNFQIILHT